MITDGVFRLIGHKPRRGAGRSCPCPGSVGDALPAFIGARPTRACATGLDGDALPAFIGAPSGSPAPVREYCISEGAWRQGNGGGFAALEASCLRVAGVSRLYWCNSPRLLAPSTWAKLNRAPLTAQVPPFGSGDVEVQGVEVAVQGGEVAVRGGVAPKVPTTSAKNANNGPSGARWSAIWTQRRLASCGARTEPLNMRVNAFDTYVNLSTCA